MATIENRIIALEERCAALEAQLAAKPVKVVTAKAVTVGETTADDYRLGAIDGDLCQARKLKPTAMDKRWAPTVYYENQCASKPVDDGLCAGCAKLLEKESEAGKFKHWNGRVGEDPLDHVHMLGTEWASKCKWVGGEASPAKAPKEDKSAAKEDKSAAKEAEKAAKVAAKEAEKAAKAAAKEAEKEAAKALKEAEKLAKAAEKAAEKAAAKPKTEAKPKAESKVKAVTEVKAAVEAPADGNMDIILIDGEMRATKNGNVYEIDELTQEPGDFIGRLVGTKEAPAVDADAEEVLSDDE
jgi:chemotaxis protein histidine kinase CheA